MTVVHFVAAATRIDCSMHHALWERPGSNPGPWDTERNDCSIMVLFTARVSVTRGPQVHIFSPDILQADTYRYAFCLELFSEISLI